MRAAWHLRPIGHDLHVPAAAAGADQSPLRGDMDGPGLCREDRAAAQLKKKAVSVQLADFRCGAWRCL